ncbi:MAG: fumarylacetoacetate hydrolase family protein [Acidobacteriota bacterium]|nr:fumarylacetoacetate hydrolase family protein [Acidobacteriota bacterium]
MSAPRYAVRRALPILNMRTHPAALARELLTAYETGEPLRALPSAADPEFDMAAAYAVEAEFRRLRVASGRAVTGRKVGYANKAMWRALKLETLVWASMYDDTTHEGPHHGPSALSVDRFMIPRLEPEIVFKLRQPLSGNPDASSALDHVEWIALGFEIIDCPFPSWQFKPSDFVAAYGLHRALVIGEHRPVEAGFLDSLTAFRLRLYKNGELIEEGAGRNSLRSPALCLAELARAAGSLDTGEIVSSGTLTGPQSIAAGETWHAEIEGLPLPKLELGFV